MQATSTSLWDDDPPPKAPPEAAPEAAALEPQPDLPDDDIPAPAVRSVRRNRVLDKAAPLLALAASFRSGRALVTLPQLHRRATAVLSDIDASLSSVYPDAQRKRASYALCATIDDIVLNLPGNAGEKAEWVRRSLVVTHFKEAIGGDRFWQLVDDMLARPQEFADLIELYHACLAVGFQGKYRVVADGDARLRDIMNRLYGAIDHSRSITTAEISTQWRGRPTPPAKIGFWSIIALAAGAACALLVVVFIALKLLLMQTGGSTAEALQRVIPETPLRLAHNAHPEPPPHSDQGDALAAFLAPEIQQKLVTVVTDGETVRVRTTVGQLFKPGSDQLEAGRAALFGRIADAVEKQPGDVVVEGHTDSDAVHGLSFPDNQSLAMARAQAVAALLQARLSVPNRVKTVSYGASRPLSSNDTAEGKAQNRRVEIVLTRTR